MDQQTKLIILSAIAGMAVMGVGVFLWSSVRAIKTASRRRFGSRPVDRETNAGCACPPLPGPVCVPARVTLPDQTPVAIYGVSTADCGCSGGDGRLNQAQVQRIVDRANKLRTLKQETELDDLLSQLRVTPRASSSTAAQ